MDKIFIFGFPHCGTTILRKIIGQHKDVFEIKYETDSDSPNNKNTINSHIVYKYPFTKSIFFGEKFKSHKKIFIIRNPLWVFSSINKRFNNIIPKDHSIKNYETTLALFLEKNKIESDDLFVVKYEDLFDDDYQKIYEILNFSNLVNDDMILSNENYKASLYNKPVPETEPLNSDHISYRIWQTNQPFLNNNIFEKLYLSEAQLEEINNIKNIRYVYPNIEDIINDYKKLNN